MVDQRIGGWAFIIGVVIAIIAGLVSEAVAGYAGWIGLVLVILGLIVGFLNLNDKEMQPFLIAAIALMLTGGAFYTLSITPGIGILASIFKYLNSMVYNIVVFVAPATLVVSLKSVYRLAARPSKA